MQENTKLPQTTIVTYLDMISGWVMVWNLTSQGYLRGHVFSHDLCFLWNSPLPFHFTAQCRGYVSELWRSLMVHKCIQDHTAKTAGLFSFRLVPLQWLHAWSDTDICCFSFLIQIILCCCSIPERHYLMFGKFFNVRLRIWKKKPKIHNMSLLIKKFGCFSHTHCY